MSSWVDNKSYPKVKFRFVSTEKKFFKNDFSRRGGESTEDTAGTKAGVNVVLPCYLTIVHRPRSAGSR